MIYEFCVTSVVIFYRTKSRLVPNFPFNFIILNNMYKYVKCFPEYDSYFVEATKEDNGSFKGYCSSHITNDLTSSTYNSDHLIVSCVSFVQFLTSLSKKPSNDEVHGYLYLYYWLYHAVLIKNITNDVFLNIQTLAVLYENLKKFKNKEFCNNDKCKCSHNIVNLYTKYIDDCRKGVNTEFCNELDNFRNMYNKHMEKPNECDEVQKILPSARITDNTLIIITPFVIAFVLSCGLFISYKVNKNSI
ncbi:hypothetical protein PVMG_00733 [Plasmodium vivax Mauritania I]|uniref:Variable surface protein n=1 Tax=Plasmodium vivax Mauritania I TaxID=1035515 RepID=A0A0J9T8Q0_PLAVI|nr:hypothetical protein PVMG_00733 [Plasmodium vivax Mauritania I]